ncbi:hypothetical protein [Amycolatopsis anabasis]|uniref:hypothetical protein n=1 Tax=Amycolatopsis anabasis TaxID=1840409 RepID=UPI00131D0CAD|nr:hypothetical protein [Amycolatopsis anabasis]
MTTVFELFEEAVRPVLDAVPKRAMVDDLYAPGTTDEDMLRMPGPGSSDPADLVAEAEQHNALAVALEHMGIGKLGELNETGKRVYSVMLRGPIRSVMTGVHEKWPSPIDVRCYADEKSGIVWNWRPDGSAMVRGGTTCWEIPERIIECLPDHPEGEQNTVQIRADTAGVIPDSHRTELDAVRAVLGRPRVGTILIELLAYDGMFAEYPRDGFALIDTDLGRYALTVYDTELMPYCGLNLIAYSNDALAGWIGDCIEAAIPREDD